MPAKKWTREKCIADALRFATRNEWRTRSGSAYNAAKRLGIFDECCSHMKNLLTFWTIEACREIASKYDTPFAWQKGHKNSYEAAHRNGWVPGLTKGMARARSRWTRDDCLADAKRFKRASDWKNGSPSAYRVASKNGWTECWDYFEVTRVAWTFELCSASAAKFKSNADWLDGDHNAYQYAAKRGWLKCIRNIYFGDGYRRTQKRYIYALVDHIKKIAYVGLGANPEARKSRHLKEKPELQDSESKGQLEFIISPRAYVPYSAKKRERQGVELWKSRGYRLLNKAVAGALGCIPKKWTKEAVLLEARKYRTRWEFQQKNNTAYNAARFQKILDLACAHMSLVRPNWSLKMCIADARTYRSYKDWRSANAKGWRSARARGWLTEIKRRVWSRKKHSV